ncbi:hypothetical protein GCM10027079_02400 [Sediminivirga luteola]|uniref:Transposase n=1 Tax=Sediminivirga luteola TaxID=1774748 RepID=A0A8J2TXE1_9MICO|nr:hypothetical protein GCM10011333_12240 [Sediminivirga luteola]
MSTLERLFARVHWLEGENKRLEARLRRERERRRAAEARAAVRTKPAAPAGGPDPEGAARLEAIVRDIYGSRK